MSEQFDFDDQKYAAPEPEIKPRSNGAMLGWLLASVSFLLMLGVGGYVFYRWNEIEQMKASATALAKQKQENDERSIRQSPPKELQKVNDKSSSDTEVQQDRHRNQKIPMPDQEPIPGPQFKKEFTIQDRLADGRAACREGRLKDAEVYFALGVIQCSDGDPGKLIMKAEFCFRLFYLTKKQEWQFDFHDNMRLAGANLQMMKDEKKRIASDHFRLIKGE